MTDNNNNKLFKFHLDAFEKKYNTRPEFLYRMHRTRYNTAVMKPMSFFAPFYNSQGWVLKGAVVYFLYYWLIKSKPHSKHWNRVGYVYEKDHKTPNLTV